MKRLLIHVVGFNLGLMMRSLFGVGTARGLQGLYGYVLAFVLAVWAALRQTLLPRTPHLAIGDAGDAFEQSAPSIPPVPTKQCFTTGC